MTDNTARLALPLLQAGQAQKEITHNEALALVDIVLQASVLSAGLSDPPIDPAEGQCWLVGPAPTGAWAGESGSLAGRTAGGWRFVRPAEGMAVWDQAGGVVLRRRQGAWVIGELTGARLVLGGKQVVGGRGPAIQAPSGGTTVDFESRATLAAVLSAIRNPRPDR